MRSTEARPAQTTPWKPLVAGGLALGWLVLAQQRYRLGIAWEDSYHHWLRAAQFARTGLLLDPLTGSSNGWLPLYDLLAGCVLALVGWHNLDALMLLSALLTLATGALLARQWGLVSGALFLFNPVTVLTGSLPVAEPLSTLLVVAALAGAQKGHSKRTALFWSGAVLCDRGVWPIAVLAILWQWLTGPRARERVLQVGPLLALGLGLWLTRADSNRTALWAAVDQQQLPGAWERLEALWTYSWRPLLLPTLLAVAGYWHRANPRIALLSLGYLVVIAALVSRGDLTGSNRYYLVLVALLAILASGLSGFTRLLAVPATVMLVVFTQHYLTLWPQWVVLNRPSELAGRWLARTGKPGTLLTDSPVVVYWSGYPPERVYGSQKRDGLMENTEFVAAVIDERYTRLYPLLVRYPELLHGGVPPGWQMVYDAADWTVRYGAKPVRVYRVL